MLILIKKLLNPIKILPILIKEVRLLPVIHGLLSIIAGWDLGYV